MENYECNNLQKAIEIALGVATQWGDEVTDPTLDIWYRGVNDNYDLQPSSYWKDIDETYSINVFRQLVRNITVTGGFDDWDYYGLARHHRIPTRLLDWTEGLIQALFFAFDGCDDKHKGTPCIWILRPIALNELAVGDASIFVPGTEKSKFTKFWLPPIEKQEIKIEGKIWNNEKPIAIFPAKSNPRIIGQLGTYTVHGIDKTPLNQILEATGNSNTQLARIDFIDLDIKKVKRDLYYLGLRQSVIYPDPDHIAQDIGYMYGWLD